MTCIHTVENISKHRDIEFCYFFTVTYLSLGYKLPGQFLQEYFPTVRYYCEISRDQIIDFFYRHQVTKQKYFKEHTHDWFYEATSLGFKIPLTVQTIVDKYLE